MIDTPKVDVTETDFDANYTLVPECSKDEFNRAYGNAMTSFGAIEGSMVYAYAALFPRRDRIAAYEAFWKKGTFAKQMDMFGDALKSTRFDDVLWREWEELRKTIEDAKKGRNKVAHMHVWQMRGHGMFGLNPKEGVRDLPMDWAEREKVDHVFTTNKLEELAREFDNAAKLIRAFEKRIEARSLV